MKNRYNAIINDNILLEYIFLKDGKPVDITWTKIEIYNVNPIVNPLAIPIQIILPFQIAKIDTGKYEAIMNQVDTVGTYYDKQTWIDLDSETKIEVSQIAVRLAVVDGISHKLKGYAFNNPDLQARNGWGAIITPDEIRDNYMFGIPLVSPDGNIITDDMLQEHIDGGVAMVERSFNVKLYKKYFKARSSKINVDRTDIDSNLIPDIDFFWEEAYDFDKKSFNNFINIKLRNRPLIKVEKIEMRDLLGNLIVDLMQWCKPNYRYASLEFFPFSGAMINIMSMMQTDFSLVAGMTQLDYYPDAFFIDYTAGFESAAHLKAMYPELFKICGMTSALFTMYEMGEGRVSGIASSSLGLGEISESYQTTASAENSMLSAKIKAYITHLDKFYKENQRKYGGLLIKAL